MFIENKYLKWYNAIIAAACTREKLPGAYVEHHHIVPRSPGGTNSKSNIVRLSPREHFVCHLLLPKITSGNARYKMMFALSMITKAMNIGAGRYRPSSKLYESARRQYLEASSHYWTEDRRAAQALRASVDHKGRKASDVTKERLRNKRWSATAIESRLANCLASAARRKGVKNPAHGEAVFRLYVEQNIDTIRKVWELYDQGVNRRQISIKMGISWDRVGTAIKHREKIQTVIGQVL